MHARLLNHFREMKFMYDYLGGVSLTEGDMISFSPFMGRSRKIKLKRTKVQFATDNIRPDEKEMISYKLGRLGKEKLDYILEKREVRSQCNELASRFILKSKCKIPFRLNGVYSYEAYIEKGDKLELGYNVIEFNCSKRFQADDFSLTPSQIKIAHSELPIMLEGETGTGKTSIAKYIHNKTKSEKPFVHINLSSFSEKLIESELFGHVKGAFTGAMNDKMGALEQAHGGTLFIDEIDSLPMELQTKLLIFLDEKVVRKVGGSNDKVIKCRLIFASGKSLNHLLNQRKIRQDFYYRIVSGAVIKLKSLRDEPRKIQECCEKFELENKVHITQELIDFYKSLPWPGNFRQLKSHLNKKKVISTSSKFIFDEVDERLIIESSDLINMNTFSEKELTLDELKYQYVQSMLMKYKNNKSAVAKVLGITSRSVKTICEKSI